MAGGSGSTKKGHPGPNSQHEEHAPSYHASSHYALHLKDSSNSSVPQAEDQSFNQGFRGTCIQITVLIKRHVKGKKISDTLMLWNKTHRPWLNRLIYASSDPGFMVYRVQVQTLASWSTRCQLRTWLHGLPGSSSDPGLMVYWMWIPDTLMNFPWFQPLPVLTALIVQNLWRIYKANSVTFNGITQSLPALSRIPLSPEPQNILSLEDRIVAGVVKD